MSGKRVAFTLLELCVAIASLSALAWARRYGGYPVSEVAHFAGLVLIASSILLATLRADVATVVLILVFIGVPLMGVFSFLVPPPVGYYGQVLNFVAGSIVVVVVAAGFGAKKLRADNLDGSRVSRGLFLGNLGLALVLALSTGFLERLLPTRHLDNGVLLRSVVLGVGKNPDMVGTSEPLLEGNTAYLAGESALVAVDLDEGEVVLRIPLPELDKSSFVPDDDSLAIVTGSYAGSQWVYRVGPESLTIVRHLPTERNWFTFVQTSVDLASQSANEWVRGGNPPPGWGEPRPSSYWILQVGDTEVSFRTRRVLATTTPQGTVFVPLIGDAIFILRTGENRAVIGTSQDRLYIITRDDPGE